MKFIIFTPYIFKEIVLHACYYIRVRVMILSIFNKLYK